MAKQVKQAQANVSGLIKAYIAESNGLVKAEAGLEAVKGNVSKVAAELAAGVGVDASQGGAYKLLGEVADPTFKGWWDKLEGGDRKRLARRAEIGAGYAAMKNKAGAAQKVKAGTIESVLAFVAAADAEALDKVEEGIKARRKALAELTKNPAKALAAAAGVDKATMDKLMAALAGAGLLAKA